MTYTHIFFDLDGTLTDPFEGITNSVRYALRKLKRDIPPDEVLRKFIGPPLTYSFVHFCGMTEEEAEQAVVLYREYYKPHGVLQNILLPGVPEMLQNLHGAGYKLILATSKPEVFARQIIEGFGLALYFTFIGGASFDKSRAEKKDVMAYAMAAVGLSDAKGCLMVGDREHDVLGAAALSMPCLGFLGGYGSREELEKAGAVSIAATPKEIETFIFQQERKG